MNKIGIAKIEVIKKAEGTSVCIEGNGKDLLVLYAIITEKLNNIVPTELLKEVFLTGITNDEKSNPTGDKDELEKIVRKFFGL